MESLPLVVPVRFSGGGLTMQTTTGRIAADAIFVRCVVTPKDGARVSLQLTLPDAPQPLQLSGTASRREEEKELGFWVKLTDVSAEARSVLDALSRPGPEGGKRAYPRVRTRLQVKWKSAREFLVAYSENISRGGIFVATAKPPAVREIVELLLELPDAGPPARTDAEVVQCVTPEEARAQRRVAGAGLQFVGSDDEFRRRLDACIENLLKE